MYNGTLETCLKKNQMMKKTDLFLMNQIIQRMLLRIVLEGQYCSISGFQLAALEV